MPNNLNQGVVWLVGAGYMAKEYATVLDAQGINYLVIGNSEAKCKSFEEEFGKPVISGGVDAWLKSQPERPVAAINAVSVTSLYETTQALLQYGVKEILVEKPAGLSARELDGLSAVATEKGSKVLVGYNRRFHASVEKAMKLIEEDGGVTSFDFEFTEWSHRLCNQEIPEQVAEQWVFSNSSHVIDMAFYMGGWPQSMSTYKSGSLSWHPSGSVYVGAGVSDTGALFSYKANWAAPGRWGVEVMTAKRRFIFRPLEKLQVQDLGTVTSYDIEIDDQLDLDFKPGLYKQTDLFLKNDHSKLLTIQEQADHFKDVYSLIDSDA